MLGVGRDCNKEGSQQGPTHHQDPAAPFNHLPCLLHSESALILVIQGFKLENVLARFFFQIRLESLPVLKG